MGMEAMAAQFLANYFKTISEEVECPPNALYVSISFDPKWDNKLRLMLIKNGNELLKSSDYNEKEEVECSKEEWTEYLRDRATHSPLEWRERKKIAYSLVDIFGE
jgi:hypothetical protein